MKMAQYQAYALANQTAPKTRQIVMLYDGVIRYLRQTREAIEEQRIEERYNLLLKASEVIMGLQSCLDFNDGGDVALALYDFYSSIDARILSLHGTQSLPVCDQLVADLKQMRDIWTGIDQMQEKDGATRPAPAASPVTSEAAAQPASPAGGLVISA